MKRWAISIACVKDSSIRHGAGVVEAASHDEAIGIGLRVARKLYPPADGFGFHDVVAHPAGVVIDPDTAILLPDGYYA